MIMNENKKDINVCQGLLIFFLMKLGSWQNWHKKKFLKLFLKLQIISEPFQHWQAFFCTIQAEHKLFYVKGELDFYIF